MFSLIGRLDLVKLKFETTVTSLNNQWKLTGNSHFIPIGKGFFIIKLEYEIDKEYIWNRYWEVESQILSLREWEPNFKPANQKVTTAFVWAHFPRLRMEYRKEKIIMELGDRIGRAIKVDETTLQRKVGYYASVLVEIDLTQRIPNHIQIKSKYRTFEQEIQIPRIPKFCNHCKIVGHLVTECRSSRKEVNVEHNDDFISVQPKNVWRVKQKKITPVGFDIAPTPSKLNSVNSAEDIIVSSVSTNSVLIPSSTTIPKTPEDHVSVNEVGEQSGIIKEIHQVGMLSPIQMPVISANKFNPIAEADENAYYSSS
ncbi:uncharacterized protein LOC113271921 [Papaver somniferum]|uniref:uncharacterized protein LOC113271921 n=1 Tax=Papaver somniferum TaxID=3469 RepID=UPI000E6FC2DE|nr:uncharacterized protein LOC113271921 [Papaver somniferum]